MAMQFFFGERETAYQKLQRQMENLKFDTKTDQKTLTESSIDVQIHENLPRV